MAQSAASEATDRWGRNADAAFLARREHGAVVRSDEPVAIEFVVDLAGISTLTPEYLRLYQVTGNTLPYATQEWHLAWCEHLLSRDPLVSQQPLFCVLRADDGRCVAILPLIITRKRLGPLKFAALALVGADPSLTELRNPLIEPGFERATVRAVHERLATMPGWDLIQWNGISAALAQALALEAVPHWYQTLDDYVVDLHSSWPEYVATLGRNMRKTLRRSYDSLRRDRHCFEFVIARDPVEVRWALLRFLELHTLRANKPSGPVHEDRFTTRTLRAFLYAVCERLAARDAVRVFQLRIADEVVASRIGFFMGDGIYLYHSGYDPAWARYGVMTTLMAETVRYAMAGGLQSINLSLVGEHSKLRWRPRRVDFYSAVVHRASVRSRLACSAYRLAMSDGGGARRLLRRFLQTRRDWN